MRNAALGNFTPFDQRTDKGAVLENAVFRQLLTGMKNWEMRFWRTFGKAEVDMVLTRNEAVVPVESKAGGGSLGHSFHSFLGAYKPSRAAVVTLDTFKRERVGKTDVMWVPVYYL